MVNSIRHESNGGHQPLPAPNVVVARFGTPVFELSPAAMKGVLVNPIHTGIEPYWLTSNESKAEYLRM
jgi:hypothetical protein